MRSAQRMTEALEGLFEAQNVGVGGRSIQFEVVHDVLQATLCPGGIGSTVAD